MTFELDLAGLGVSLQRVGIHPGAEAATVSGEDDPDDARDAAEVLEAALAREPERYPGLFLPGADPYYDDFGLYYLERDELVDLAARIESFVAGSICRSRTPVRKL